MTNLDKLVHYYRREFDITYNEMIGTLYIVLHDLSDEALSEEGNDDDDTDTDYCNAP